MGKNSYQKAKDLLINLKEREGNKIKLDILRNEIKAMIGRDELRVVTPYLHFMNDMHLIKSKEFDIEILI